MPAPQLLMSPDEHELQPTHYQDEISEPQPARVSVIHLKPALKQLGKAKSDKDYQKRNITWLDFHGHELTQVLEYEPSEHDESDDGDMQDKQACCVIC